MVIVERPKNGYKNIDPHSLKKTNKVIKINNSEREEDNQ